MKSSVRSIGSSVIYLFIALATVALCGAPALAASEVVCDWQFNTAGDTEGWISRSSWYIPGGIFVDTAVDSTATVLTAVDLGGNGDVGVLLGGDQLPLELPENCSNWTKFTIRLRQLDANPPEGNPVAFAGGAKVWLDGIGFAQDLPSSSSGIWTVENQSDNWTVFSADLSDLADAGNDISSVRVDPISSTEGNFEIDYIQIEARVVNFASTYYLDAVNGNDETGDGTELNPFKSVAAVWDLLEDGNTVILASGNYGSIELYNDGWYTEPADIFTDYVTFQAADGADCVFDQIHIGTHTSPDTNYTDGFNAKYDIFLRFNDLKIADGVIIQNGGSVEFNNCLITREGPYVGSEEKIEKIAVQLTAARAVTLKSCEITDTGVGIFASGHDVNILNSHIHDGSHDGIRPWGLRDSLIAGNDIHGFDDGVDDDEGYDWNRHCDLIHFSIRGPGYEGWGCNNVTVRGNRFYDAQGQALIINGYLGTPTRHSNIIIEDNIFTPVASTMVNLVEKTDGVIFRGNTILKLDTPTIYNGYTMDNSTVRFGGDLTGVEIFNNIFVSCSVDSGCGIDFFDYNMIKNPSSSTHGLDESRGYGRFNILEEYPTFVDAASYDGVLASGSLAVNAGTAIMAPSVPHDSDIAGTPRDARPDMGAWEQPGLAPAAETPPVAYDDTKTCFVDDFDDGHYNDIDPYLQAPATQGMSWYCPDGYSYKYSVTYQSDRLSRNSLVMPNGTTVSREAWLLSEQGGDWQDYSFRFDCNNAYLGTGGGVTVLAIDENNCYYIDLAASAGRLVRVMNGQETLLDTSSAIVMPNTGERSYCVDVNVEPDGITISVDADDNGSIDFSYTDTDAIALAVFEAGGVGFHCDNDDQWHVLYFDNVEVNVSSFIGGDEYLPGDANRDGNVDIYDFLILRSNYGLQTGASWAQGDFNADGSVNIYDFLLLRGNYGS